MNPLSQSQLPKVPVVTPPQPPPSRRPAKWLLSCILILVIGAGSALLIRNQIQQGAHASHTVTVDETATSFSPSDIVIQQGDSVIWVNEDTQAHDVKSDSDTISLSANEKRTITYTKKGMYMYFDSMNPKLQVMITVK